MSFRKNDPNRKTQELLFEQTNTYLVMVRNRGMTFFEPDMEFVRWLVAYANGRMIIEVGSGTGHVMYMLHHAGHHKLMGFEPSWNVTDHMSMAMAAGEDTLHILPYNTEDPIAQRMLKELTKSGQCLLLSCRPCHSGFVEAAVDAVAKGTEVMYITKPENLERYEDLGEYQELLTEVQHQGTSTDNESVYVFVKP